MRIAITLVLLLPAFAQSADLTAQLELQDEAAQALRAARDRLGALNFDRVEAQPVINAGTLYG